tara:strand:+ start:176 stop:436 length:261 start_codon:yes stop_codon:yes gene_type:complete
VEAALDNLLVILEMVVQEEVVELVALREVQVILLQLLRHKELMVEQLLRALVQEMVLVAEVVLVVLVVMDQTQAQAVMGVMVQQVQ